MSTAPVHRLGEVSDDMSLCDYNKSIVLVLSHTYGDLEQKLLGRL
jgi:hypothetical protein